MKRSNIIYRNTISQSKELILFILKANTYYNYSILRQMYILWRIKYFSISLNIYILPKIAFTRNC